MFITDSELIDVSIYYKKAGHRYIAYTKKDFKDARLNDEEKSKYSKLTVKMSQLTWGMYNSLQEDAMVDSGSGDRQFNFKIYKENRLRRLIKEWDAKQDNKPVPVNEKSISMLSPIIAETILKGYDEEEMLSEEEEGKS